MTRVRFIFVAMLATSAATALAEPPAPSLDQRVDRVERELRAVQRKVFPGGAPAFSEPEIAPTAPTAPPTDAGLTPLNALVARVDSLEREVEQMTGQVEQLQHRLSIASEQAARDRQEFDTRLKALESPAAASPPSPPTMGDETTPATVRQPTPVRASKPSAAKPVSKAASTRAEDEPAGDGALSSTAATGDPAEDAYMAGYTLWEQKKYPEAEAALKKMVAKYPKHRRASYAQNLLGRAYLDDGQPASAAEAFAANYQGNPRGERAPDSLYYLGQALIQLKKPADACRVYDELDSAYGATLSTSLKSREATARREAKCAK